MKSFILSVLGICTATVLLASAVYAGPTDDPGIQARMENQQRRIERGIESGQLIPVETGKLEGEQAKIKQDELRMKSDGILTKRERAKLHRELNRSSRHIYREKHDGQRVNVGQ